MAPAPLPVQGGISDIQSTPGGPVRVSAQRPDTEILLTIPHQGGREPRCPALPLAHGASIRISPPPVDSQGHWDPREGGSSPGGPILAQETMVCRSSQSVSGPPVEDSARQGLAVPGTSSAPKSTVASVSRLEVERERLRNEGLSAQVINTILAARRPSTTRIYNATWNIFCKWCHKSSINPLSPSIAQILAFLQDGLDRGLSPNTLRRQVAALSTVVSGSSSGSLSHHPRIRAFLRGASNLHPPVIHRYPTWDLNKVLMALTKPPFEPLREAPLQFLTLKVVFLVAVTSARRISEIAALSITGTGSS
ncbi:uncharacterized protein LOC113419749 [Notechis scutatus]|uniref:Uncharacterized protein LOC113419749 n=1 Tax=Notechis scutatus TaxID=8663 RepID=A0A6J1V5K9_9SAUR|nr:uncharacterized protein LOC113419749 [Notechis scutatus]